MKKAIVVTIISVFVLILLSSCNTTQDCPAYGQAETPENTDVSI